MKILGCFKIVPDLDMIPESDWTADEQYKVDVSFVKTLWNCFDESALEMMLKLSDLSEGFDVIFRLQALTVGEEQCEAYLKTLYALRFEKGIRIEPEGDLKFRPDIIAEAISRYVEKEADVDVIFMGRQSSDDDNAMTPLLAAEMLGWPCITQVVKVSPASENTLKVTSEADGGTMTQVVKTPCILTVGNAADTYLRVPTLKDRMQLAKQPIEVIPLHELELKATGQAGITGKITGLSRVKNERNTILIEGDTAQEKAEKLYQLLKDRRN